MRPHHHPHTLGVRAGAARLRTAISGAATVIATAVGCTNSVDTSWHQEANLRWRALAVPPRGRVGFTQLGAAITGLDHANTVEDEHALANRNLLIGAGAAVADIDDDGLPDVFLASVERPGALYKNMGGFTFRDVTQSSGVTLTGQPTTGAAFADVDGDGDADLLVGSLGGALSLFTNNGAGKFTNATSASGLDSGFAATTLALADVDGDQDLDLYVATYKVRNALDAFPPQARAFDQVVKKVGDRYQVIPEWEQEFRIEDRPDLGGIVRSQRAEPDLFYLNDGRGRFVRQPTNGSRWRDERGQPLAQQPDYFSLAARFADLNHDGAPDLYVCNDFEDPDQIWINDRSGGFQLISPLAIRATSNTCMSVAFADVDRNGTLDFFTADMLSPTRAARQRQIPTHTPLPKTIGQSADRGQWMQNTLQLGRGDGTFAQVADFAGLAATDWTWGSAFVDVDLDGYEDLLVASGHRWDVRDADTFDRIRNAFPRVPWNREQGEFPRLAVPSHVFRNEHDATFQDVTSRWKFGIDSAIAHAIALADFDGDGDLDPLLTRLGQSPLVYRNEGNAPRLAVRLTSSSGNTSGIGATIEVNGTSQPVQSAYLDAGGPYLSGDQPVRVFATGSDSVLTIRVTWPNGKVTTVPNARPNRLYEITDKSTTDARSKAPTTPPLFEDKSALLGGHAHYEAAYDDFARQPLLPNRLSQLGPGLSWIDVDADGKEDLVVGDGKGGAISVLLNGPRGFARATGAPLAGDAGTILPYPDATGRQSLIVSQSTYEAASRAEALAMPSLGIVRPAAARLGTTIEPLRHDTTVAGALALGDVNGDGWLDVFVGTRAVPGAWPIPAPSHISLGSATGSFRADSVNAGALRTLGLVTAATFADLNADGWPDLVAASEWGPVRVLLNHNGALTDATQALGLSTTTSRWFGVAAGDFDGDGQLDLVATSWGRNLPWHASTAHPFTLSVTSGEEGVQLVAAMFDSLTKQEMPVEPFSRLGVAIPDLKTRIGSYAQFSEANVDDVLGPRAARAIRVGATTFDHTLFLNRKGTFVARPLPNVAQMAPASAPVVADFNGDGSEDLFLSQNYFPTAIGTLRFDAGAGLVLLGDGHGGFTPLGVLESGISVLGDQRGAATADYDGDGRPDLAVSQNGWQTRLFRNAIGVPGLRVTLSAGKNNPLGIGAQVRLWQGGSLGPVREVHAGSGYWSVDGATMVLASPKGTDSVWVRWPGGAVQTRVVSPSERGVAISQRP